MSETLRWWVMMQVVGLALLPLCLTLFRRLPDRGYGLSKPFALLLVGYLFWIFVLLGLPNITSSIWLVLTLFASGSAYLFWRRRDELLTFVRQHLWLIGATEALFFLAFVIAAYLRSFVPEITGTEKPMDFMFLNAITHAQSFPPPDPWLAGESVSYYYFGYLLVSVMTRLSGLATSIGYNLGLAMIVALTVTAAFSLVYNLAASREQHATEGGPGSPGTGFSPRALWRPMVFGLVAALLLAVMGNLEGLLEWLAAHHIGGDGFWSWLNIQNAELVPYESSRWFPDQFWFWFRATRVIEASDGLFGIHEFPFFSFLLGDLHPHVMSIPFILLALGAAFALLRSEGPLDLVYWLERPLWLVALAVMLGGLAFLNTWDMPTIMFVILLVALLRNRLLAERWSWGLLLDSIGFALPLFIAAFLAYLPFFFGGFDSQASGFSADPSQGTRLFHALLIWGPFAVLVLPYAAWRLMRGGGEIAGPAVLALALPLGIVGVWLIWDGLEFILGWLPNIVHLNDASGGFWERISARGSHWLTVPVLGASLSLLVLALVREVGAAKDSAEEHLSHIFALGAAAVAALLILGAEFFFIQDQFNSRMNTVFKLYYQAWLLLSIAGGFVLYELARSWPVQAMPRPRSVAFDASLGNWSLGEVAVVTASFGGAVAGIVLMRETVLGLIIVGALVGAGLLFVSSAAGVLLWRAAARQPSVDASSGALSWRAVWAGAAAVLLLSAFVYPITATFERTAASVDGELRAFERPRNLNGLAYLQKDNPDEYAAIQWLLERDGQPVIAEAIGEGYHTETSRVSGVTGLPTILGWPGHESQWRGGYDDQAGRPEDLQQLYTSPDTDAVKSVIQKYDIRYVFVGPAERGAYGQVSVSENELFERVFPEEGVEPGEVVIYRVRAGAFSNVTRE